MKSALHTIIITIALTFCIAFVCSADLLSNPGLEEPYNAISNNPNSKANIIGFIASGWVDNSGWAEVSIKYDKDTSNFHGGKAAQKVEVQEIRSGRAQFAQDIKI